MSALHLFHPLRRTAATIGRAFLDILAPRHCELCSRAMDKTSNKFEFVCTPCVDSLLPAPYPEEVLNRLVARFPGDALALSRVAALYAMSDTPPLYKLLYALKYKGRKRIGEEFGRELGEVLVLLGFTRYDALVPVPIHAAKFHERGYNQAENIAIGTGELLRVPVYTDLILRSRYTPSQTTLNAEKRQHNVGGAFAPGNREEAIRGGSFLLIDDVLTTGSTLNACATSLLELGARQVDAATLAVA